MRNTFKFVPILATVALSTIASPVSAAPSSCVHNVNYATSAAKGIQFAVKADQPPRIAEGIPLELASKNTTSSALFVRYEPLAVLLTFFAADTTGTCVPSRSSPLSGATLLMHGFVAAGDVLQLPVKLRDYVPIDTPGTYTVVARIRPVLESNNPKHGEWIELVSAPVNITVVP